jgi:methyl-accepting chemotaxis protein
MKGALRMKEKEKVLKEKARRQGLGIKWKMIGMIVPIVVIALLAVTIISTNKAGTAIDSVTSNYVNAEIEKNVTDIDANLESVRSTAENLSVFVSATYSAMPINGFQDVFGDMVLNSDLITGAGIWFEPYAYIGDENYAQEEYVGPYWYEDGDSIVEDWSYSNAEYDYFNQEYYLNAKAMTSLDAVITDPYYDPSSGTIMASCSAPIFDASGNYIGCVTCDITLDIIAELVSSIKIGNSGMAQMVSSDGTYIYCNETEKYENGENILNNDTGIKNIASAFISNQSGVEQFADGSMKFNAYYSTVPEVNWKLIVVMLQSEVEEAVNNIKSLMYVVGVVSVLLVIVIIYFVATAIAKTITEVNRFANELAAGDFTVNEMKTKRSDELGAMSKALNDMYKSNKNIIGNISNESGNINDSASTLGAMSEELAAEFSKIQSNMVSVNDAMMSTGAATEEVSASVQEVNTSVEDLARETETAGREVANIKQRAADIGAKSKAAHDSAIQIAEERREELETAASKAEVVNEIANLANSISDIASQINLLSLNASIEAARAGDAGKGFAVVAQEINKLATETDSAVMQIQETIDSVQEAFSDLSAGSNKLLEFLTETVTPDYDNFIEVGRQYGEDAELFANLSSKIEEMTDSIKASMNEVNKAVQNIAESTQETASSSADVTDSVNSVSDAVDSVADLATKQQVTASNLSDIVSNFKLN